MRKNKVKEKLLKGEPVLGIWQGINSIEAVDNLEEIPKLEEIDVVFIGAADLSQSLGFPGEYNNTIVKNTIKEAIKKIVNSGTSSWRSNFIT
ncbi:hypothetical protein KJ813_01430 [bacterium]|nr:hypothetical protein [bacterium]MBU4361309.1 hypothetical protein [bacterium]MBU4603216.1 hypothetical protein [bacterium]MCG2820873.1 aldolase/citrate lyase family protein [Candidatus Atribacteria bacterium]